MPTHLKILVYKNNSLLSSQLHSCKPINDYLISVKKKMMKNKLGLTTNLLGVFMMHLFFELIGKTKTQTTAFHYVHVHSTH